MKVQNGSIEIHTVNITVQDYFKSKQVELMMPYLPCLDVGKSKRPNYLPIEVVTLLLFKSTFYNVVWLCYKKRM